MPANKILSLYETYVPLTIFQSYGTITNSDYVTLILMLIYKESRRVKRVNVFIMNLGVVVLAVAFITMTTEILFAAFREWVLGALLCRVTVYLQVVTLSSTTFLLKGMNIDRYQVIVRPLCSLAQTPNSKT